MPAERPMPDATPTDIKLKRAEQKLIVQWPDGERIEFDAATLRQNCPCAGCRTDRRKRSTAMLPILDVVPADDITLTGVALMG